MYDWSKLGNFRLAKGSHDDARGGEMCLVEAPILRGCRIDRYFPGRSRSPVARIGPVDLMCAWSGHRRVNVRGGSQANGSATRFCHSAQSVSQ
jgi:hypothetical protein